MHLHPPCSDGCLQCTLLLGPGCSVFAPPTSRRSTDLARGHFLDPAAWRQSSSDRKMRNLTINSSYFWIKQRVCVLIRARAWWDMYVIAQRSASCGRNEVHRFERRRPAVGLKRLSAGSRDSLSQRGQWRATTERGAPAQLPRIFCTAPSTELRRFSRKKLAGGIKLTRAALSEKPRSSGCVPAREGLWGYQPTAPSHLEDPPSAPWDWRRPQTLRSGIQREPVSETD